MDYYKVMALDYGEVRIGVAMTDLMRLIASPFETYVRKSLDQDLDHICTLINDNSVKTVVVGLPLNMDGTEGERAQKTREFVDVLKTKTNVEFVFQDERLSSVSAEELLLEGGMKRKDRKQNIDKVAAAIILESYLNSKKSGVYYGKKRS